MDKSIKRIFTLAISIMMAIAFLPINTFGQENQDTESMNELIEKDISDESIYDPVYYLKHGNKKYAKSNKVQISDFAKPVTVARGIATYNYDKQKEFDVNQNSIMSLYYEIPVYDPDKDSDYYIAIPDVNSGDDRIGSYDFKLGYNNDKGELISDYKYEDGIVYIKKSVLDNPKNKMELNDENTILAMQLNYYFKDREKDSKADFSKVIPVQVLKNNEPEYLSKEIPNMFEDQSFSIDIGDYDKSKTHVMLNGSVLPISKKSYDINNGRLTIFTSPAAISSVNVVVDKSTVGERIINMFSDKAHAVTTDNMSYYKTAGGKEVVITSNLSDIYEGWRGHYEASKSIMMTSQNQTWAKNNNKKLIGDFKKLPEWQNSIKYMYGAASSGQSQTDKAFIGYWALSSYTKGVNIDSGALLAKNTEYDNPMDSSGQKRTMYEWMKYWSQRLEKNNQDIGLHTSSGGDDILNNNGLGGCTNFAVPWPKSLIKGDDRNMVSDSSAEGYAATNAGNPNIKFDTETESGKTVLTGSDYFAASCAHLAESNDDWSEDGSYDGETNRTVYVSCIAKGNDYVVLCFAIAGISKQEAMAVFKFRTGRPVQIKKISMEPDVTNGNNNYSLAGAKYKLYETQSDAKNNTDVVCSFETGSNGESNIVSVAPGSYYLVETTPSKGHIIPDAYKAANGGKKITVTGGSDTQVFSMEEPIIRGDLRLEKWDAELEASEAMGGTDLEGIEFTIYNKTGGPVAVPNIFDPNMEGYKVISWGNSGKGREALSNGTAKLVPNGEAIGNITVYKNKEKNIYEAKTGGLALPKGSYEIKETKTNKFYQLTDTSSRMVEILEHGKIYETTSAGEALVWKNNVWRQNFSFEKTGITEEGEKRLSFIPFKITNIETGEYHYVVTDQNGIFNSYTYPKTRDTNGYDEFIEGYLSEDEIVDSEELKELMLGDEIDEIAPGTWFGVGEYGTETGANDNLAGLPYGIYEVEEIRCTNNKEYTLYAPFTIEIKRATPASILNTEPDGGRGIVFEVENRVDAPVIGTTAKCEETDTNLGVVGEKATIIDTIKYENLPEEEEYTITGTLMDKSTNRPLNADGAVQTISFTPEERDGTIDMKFEINSANLMDKDLVVFEEIRKNEASPEEKPIAEHKNLGDEGQTIHFPGVGTKAEDAETKAGVGMAGEETIIVDAVAYSNLIEGRSYTIIGTLMDKETGEPVESNDRKVVSDPVTFTPEEPDGQVDVEFKLNTEDMQGKSIVAFESLSEGERELVSHSDIENEEQTVYIPKIGTRAKDKRTGTNEGTPEKSAVIIDTVEYEGLRPNLEYEVKGTLVRKSDKKPVISMGSEVTAKENFTATESNGQIDMEFHLDSRNLEGQSVVVFEEIYHKGKLVASHADPEDEGQTINYKKIKRTSKNRTKRTTTTKPKASSRSTKTGDDFFPMAVAGVMIFTLLIMLLAMLMDKKIGK